MINMTHLSEAIRIFRRSLKIKKKGIKKYPGNARQICKKIVSECWNGKYFQMSKGHYNEFYIRDFGWCADSLLKLGYREKVLKTLDYVLEIYSKQGLKTTITPAGKAIDIFEYAPDSLMYLIRSLAAAKAKKLVSKYEEFLEKEIEKYFWLVIDQETGLVTTKRTFSSMKDQSLRKSSCYDNCCTARISKDIDSLGLTNPFRKWNYPILIKENFWNGKYFEDDITKNGYVAGDANVIPFWLEIFNDQKMMKKAFSKIQKQGLDNPFPLKYSMVKPKLNFIRLFVGNYETISCWMHMGYMYVKLIKQIDKKKYQKHKKNYTQLIEKHKNFLEVFSAQGEPFKSPFYYADESMLWAANYLTL